MTKNENDASIIQFSPTRPSYLTDGQRARLIPDAGQDSCRINACTLAAIMSADEYGMSLLKSVGAPVTKTSKIECYTEVSFKTKLKAFNKPRPDGLIVVTRGKKEWRALIETKIGNQKIDKEQLEKYLDLARENEIDAVITISNQFSVTPERHPVSVDQRKIRKTGLFHWSWAYIKTEALMWILHHKLADPDQAYILEELVRYLQNPKSGAQGFNSMDPSWTKICTDVRRDTLPKKTDSKLLDCIGSWHQFIRHLSLGLSLKTATNVSAYPKGCKSKTKSNIRQHDADNLVKTKELLAEFEICNAASNVELKCDFKSREITASMRIKATAAKKTQKGQIGWLVQQLNKKEDPKKLEDDHKKLEKAPDNGDITIRAIWGKRTSDKVETLKDIRENSYEVLFNRDNPKKSIKEFEVALKRSLGTKFQGQKTFVKEAGPILLEFYSKAGQHLENWHPPAAKVIETQNPAFVETREERPYTHPISFYQAGRQQE